MHAKLGKFHGLQKALGSQFNQYLTTNLPKERVRGLLVDKSGTKTSVLIITKTELLIFQDENQTFSHRSYPRNMIETMTFVSGVPNGALKFQIRNQKFNYQNIVYGRVYDFTQSVLKRGLTGAKYDNTIRGESNYLTNADHGKEVDRLRVAMQNGKLSRYEYDDLNGSISKAGK
ncbi:histidine decarboxylase maturation protein HdcB [Fructilactobacillus fructivorans]|uniref:Uncharacterized protein n=1 Tax=Fructilactobacillus fructivorans TaxID=1614 RepID=A0AAE6TVY8_9LACO|nr:histidine decarboxylase maturation protein HdcB [Fructilactobacillus fructivorans]KRK58159.1 hypothetical protein FC73_GL000539 [Fructilactobacillus fructivorans]KRN13007.1 hypothetical protein IV37_GL000642 [Fructilactobacillus fructivorans]QFX92157.1 hypothetical protein LF543_00525 [Fructilactobacillus fructivorans]RDV65205.1 hypothetical protein DXU76_04265 [Fructilactobacillus fructivorans]